MKHIFVLALTGAIVSSFTNTTHNSPKINSANVPGTVVISQIYGAGGNSGATFRNDFVELFNRSSATVTLTGWAVQYTSATGTSWSKVDLNGSIAPGKYLLLQLAGGANGAVLPAPDLTAGIAMAATAGKVALTTSTTALTGSCPTGASIVDIVGYGTTASCFEGGGPTPAPSATNSVLRISNGCKDTDQNATDFAASAAAPRNSSSTASPCSSGGARFTTEDLKVTRSQGDPCATISIEARLTNSGTLAQRDNSGPEFLAQLPPGLIAVSGSCQSSFGSCGGAGGAISWDGSVPVGGSLIISWEMRLDLGKTSMGAELCTAITVNYDANDDGINESVTSLANCLTVSCQPGSPGIAIPEETEAGDDRPGSILVFPFYSSIAAAPASENARISLTSTSNSRSVSLHLFFISDESASVADLFMCLSPNQTKSFLASEIDPNSAGYMVAIAVDGVSGCPIRFNYLLGEAALKLEDGHAAVICAEAFSALTDEPAACNGNASTVEIRFDGIAFSKAARTVVTSSIASPADGHDTLLILNRLGGSLVSGASTLGQINGLVFNDEELGFSFSLNTSRRQLRMRINDSSLRTSPRIGTVIPAGRTGWCKLSLASDGALVAAILVAHPQARVSSGAHAGGRNLHKTSFTEAARLTIPVFPPSC
jgi:hypothetical protein